MMRFSVVFNVWKTLLYQKLFLTLEVHLRELDKPFQLKADFAAIRPAHNHPAEFVQRVHQDAVLIIHGLHSDDAVVAPGQQRHISSASSCKCSFAFETLK